MRLLRRVSLSCGALPVDRRLFAVDGFIMNEDRNRWHGRRSDGVVGEVTIPGRAWPDLGRQSDGHRRAWRGPAGHRFQLRRGCGGCQDTTASEGADQRPHRDGHAEPFAVAQCGASEQVQGVCPSVVRCGARRTSSSRSIAAARSTPRRYSHCACGSRTPAGTLITALTEHPKRAPRGKSRYKIQPALLHVEVRLGHLPRAHPTPKPP